MGDTRGLPGLPLTGERTPPAIAVENHRFQRHVATYAFVARRRSGLPVLDAGSGEGYLALTAAAAVVQPGDFRIAVAGIDSSLDLLAEAAPRGAGG